MRQPEVSLERDNKIRFGEKAAFALANLGNIPIMTLISSFLLIFYTDVVGLDPAAVATLFLVVRLLDGINDPIMGFLIDHFPRTKLGRFRTYLLIGGIICSINFVLLWFGPLWVPVGKLVVAYITYVLIGITFDLMDIPLNSLIPVMTDVEKERNSLSAIKGLFYMIGVMVISTAAPQVLSNAKTPAGGYYILVFAGVAMVIIFTTIGALGVKERIQPREDNERYKIKDVLSIIRERPVITAFLASLMYGIGGALVQSGNMFFYIYVLDNRLDLFSITSMVSIVAMLPVMAISGLVVKKLGKKKTYTFGLLLAGLAPFLRLINVTNIPLLIISSVLGGFGSGLSMPLVYGIQADNVDYVDYTRNQRVEGSIASLSSFVSKAGSGIGGAISGYILAATGYVANAVQTDSAITGIIVSVIVLPAVIFLIGALIFGLGYNINREKLTEITTTLRQRREANGTKLED